MFKIRILLIQFAIVIMLGGLGMHAMAQSTQGPGEDAATSDQQDKQNKNATKREDENPFSRFLQSNGLLVETAYHQEAGEVQHAISFSRSSREGWASRISQEWPVFS